MSSHQISKIYAVIGIFLFYFTIDTWSVTQGGQVIFGSKGVDPHRVLAAMNGIQICSFLLLLISIIGIIYARRSGGAKWHERIPILGFESLDTGSPAGKVYQTTAIVGLSIIPTIALTHFWSVFNIAPVITTTNPPLLLHSVWSWRWWDSSRRLRSCWQRSESMA